MGTKVYDNALDLITFTRASGGTALRKISYGPELVTNGTFDTNTTGWANASTPGTITLSSNKLRLTADGAASCSAVTTLSGMTSGKVYQLFYDIDPTNAGSGSARFRVETSTDLSVGNGPVNTAYSAGSGAASGVKVIFVATAATMYCGVRLTSVVGGNYAEIDNISVKEVLFDQPTGTLTLFNHPNNIPRIEYAANGTLKGLLIEEQRTNLITYSEDFTNAAWLKVNVTATSNSITATTTGTFRYVYVAPTMNNGETWTLSVWAKAGTSDYIWLLGQTSGDCFGMFNLSTGTYTTPLFGAAPNSGNIEDMGDGWYRCSITFTKTTASGVEQIGFGLSDSGGSSVTAGASVDIKYAQLEVGSFPTSYIPTSGATATRADESAILTARPFNADAGTFVAEFSYSDPNNVNTNYVMGGSGNARIMYNNSGSDAWQTFDGVSATSFLSVAGDGTSYKLGVSAKEGASTTTYKNGTQTGTKASGSLMSEVVASTVVAIGGGSATQRLNGHIKSIQYFPRRLSNAQLQELTT